MFKIILFISIFLAQTHSAEFIEEFQPSQIPHRGFENVKILKKQKLVFLHIPKTAGSTIGTILKKHYEDKLYLPDAKTEWESSWNDYDCLHIHYPPNNTLQKILENKSSDAAVFTFLRHPFSQLSSYLRFFKEMVLSGRSFFRPELQDAFSTLSLNQADHLKEITEKLGRQKSTFILLDNPVIRHFLKGDNKRNLDQESFEEALRFALSEVDYIGFQETFNESLMQMSQIFHMDQAIFRKNYVINKTGETIEKIDYENNTEIRDILTNFLRWDLLFFEKVNLAYKQRFSISLPPCPNDSHYALMKMCSSLETKVTSHEDLRHPAIEYFAKNGVEWHKSTLKIPSLDPETKTQTYRMLVKQLLLRARTDASYYLEAIHYASLMLMEDSHIDSYILLLKTLIPATPTEKLKKLIPQFTNFGKEILFLKTLLKITKDEAEKNRLLYRLHLLYKFGHSTHADTSLTLDYPAFFQLRERLTPLYPPSIVPQKKIHICMGFDDNYAPHAAVAIASLLLNALPETYYNLTILMDPDNPLSEENQSMVSELKKIKDFGVSFKNFPREKIPQACYDAKPENFAGIRWPVIIFFKLFLPNVLPDLDKVLWLDADCIIQEDLSALWNESVRDTFMAASFYDDNSYVKEYFQNIISKYNDFPHIPLVGTSLYNLKALREESSDELILRAIDAIKVDTPQFTEEMIFTEAFYPIDKLKMIPKKWCTFHEVLPQGVLQFSAPKPWIKKSTPTAQEYQAYWSIRKMLDLMDKKET